MVNDLMAAIANRLAENDGVAIYADTVRQDLSVPCFIIDLVDIQTQRRLHKTYASHLNVSVTYIGEDQDDTRDMAELMPIQLATVSHNGHTWEGGDIRVNVDDTEHTVTCIIDYFVTMQEAETVTLMQALTQKEGTKK